MFFILCHLDKTGNLNRLWRKEGVFIIPIHTLLVFIIEDAATLSRALLCHKSQPQGTAIHSTQVAGLFCWNAFFSVFLGHLVVSNGNNLIQLKKKKFIFNVVTILWHLFDKLLWSWAEARTEETSKHIFVLRCIHRDRRTDIVPCQNNPLVFLTHGIYVFLICFARV